jgi:hypothetical protein
MRPAAEKTQPECGSVRHPGRPRSGRLLCCGDCRARCVSSGCRALRLSLRGRQRQPGRQPLRRRNPPLAKQTRATSVTLPFPARPAGAIGPQVEVRSAGARNAGSHIDTTVTGDTAAAELVVTVKAVDDGGPGFDLAEVALYWVGSRLLGVSPASLSFGLIGVGEATVRSFTISNVGSEPVTVTVPGSPFPSSFGWMGCPPQPWRLGGRSR